MSNQPENLRDFNSLIQIMARLRAPNGCPWDLEQNHRTLAPYAIEEVAELVDAIERQHVPSMVEELGDVLLQVVFHAQVGRDEGTFEIGDVIESICTKLVTRHPHVFGDVNVHSSSDVVRNWDEIKKKEKAAKGAVEEKGLGVPPLLPALQRAQKIGSRTKKEKFDWKDSSGVLEKFFEEVDELKEAIGGGDSARVAHEIGDLLFTLVQLARHMNHDAEQILRDTNRRFENRYIQMRDLVEADGRDWKSLSDREKESYWQRAKGLVK